MRRFFNLFIFVALECASTRHAFSKNINDYAKFLNPKLVRYIDIDQNNNTLGAIRSKFKQLSDKDKEVVPANFSDEHWPQVLRLFDLTDNEEALGRLYETKVLSHGTHLVFDIKTGKSKFIKFKWSNDKPHISQILSKLQSKIASFGVKMVPEFFHNLYREELIVRPTEFITEAKFQVYPLHGIFNQLVKDFAQAKRVPVSEWLLNEYVEKLALMSARLNYGAGIYGAWHTQNLMIEVDDSSGLIKFFHIRDLRDFAFDPEIHVLYFDSLQLQRFRNRPDIYDRRVFTLKNSSGYGLNALFLIQDDVLRVNDDRRLKEKMLQKFLWTYAEAAAEIVGLDLDKSKLSGHYHDDESFGLRPGEYFLKELDRQIRLKIRKPVIDSRDPEIYKYLRNNFEQSTSFSRLRLKGSFLDQLLEKLFTKSVFEFDGKAIRNYRRENKGSYILDRMTILDSSEREGVTDKIKELESRKKNRQCPSSISKILK